MGQDAEQDKVIQQEVISSCVGAVGEVISQENELLFVGRLEDYDPQYNDIQMWVYKGDQVPQWASCMMPVKVQLCSKGKPVRQVSIRGKLFNFTLDYWKIQIEDVIFCEEKRRAFRQPVEVNAVLHWGPGQKFQGKCTLEDISMMGIAFHSPLKLQPGSEVRLAIPQLLEEGPAYELACRVVAGRNIAKEGEPPLWRYGCEYGELDPQVETQLCKDIFLLQSQRMNRTESTSDSRALCTLVRSVRFLAVYGMGTEGHSDDIVL